MKNVFPFTFIVALLFVNITLLAQAKYASSDPGNVAEKFLELYFKGEWFEAASSCGVEGCSTQIEIMMRKMAIDDVTDDSGKCKFVVDSVHVEQNQKSGKVFFTKTCSSNVKPVHNHITVVKLKDLWYVEYIFKRDKYL